MLTENKKDPFIFQSGGQDVVAPHSWEAPSVVQVKEPFTCYENKAIHLP